MAHKSIIGVGAHSALIQAHKSIILPVSVAFLWRLTEEDSAVEDMQFPFKLNALCSHEVFRQSRLELPSGEQFLLLFARQRVRESFRSGGEDCDLLLGRDVGEDTKFSFNRLPVSSLSETATHSVCHIIISVTSSIRMYQPLRKQLLGTTAAIHGSRAAEKSSDSGASALGIK